MICETVNAHGQVVREAMLCAGCQSTWRVRATVLAVIAATTGTHTPLARVEPNWAARGVGISDHHSIAAHMPGKFAYTNTYFHTFPRLDIRTPPPELLGTATFVLCSDVLEHVPPPVDSALRGMRSMLQKPHGFAVISVPIRSGPDSEEYYPGLASWEEHEDGSITWTDENGHSHTDPNPEFHGGGGQTLAFREWSLDDLSNRLIAAGFSTITPPVENASLGVPHLDNAGIVIAWA